MSRTYSENIEVLKCDNDPIYQTVYESGTDRTIIVQIIYILYNLLYKNVISQNEKGRSPLWCVSCIPIYKLLVAKKMREQIRFGVRKICCKLSAPFNPPRHNCLSNTTENIYQVLSQCKKPALLCITSTPIFAFLPMVLRSVVLSQGCFGTNFLCSFPRSRRSFMIKNL